MYAQELKVGTMVWVMTALVEIVSFQLCGYYLEFTFREGNQTAKVPRKKELDFYMGKPVLI